MSYEKGVALKAALRKLGREPVTYRLGENGPYCVSVLVKDAVDAFLLGAEIGPGYVRPSFAVYARGMMLYWPAYPWDDPAIMFGALAERRRTLYFAARRLNQDVKEASKGKLHHQACDLGGMRTGLPADISGDPCWCGYGELLREL